MKKEWAKKWVEALRSGKYEQGYAALQRDGKFCCLGVLCDISGLDKWETRNHITYSYLGSDNITPDKVMELTGLKDSHGKVQDITLVSLNDSRQNSFSQIADFIEDNQKSL